MEREGCRAVSDRTGHTVKPAEGLRPACRTGTGRVFRYGGRMLPGGARISLLAPVLLRPEVRPWALRCTAFGRINCPGAVCSWTACSSTRGIRAVVWPRCFCRCLSAGSGGLMPAAYCICVCIRTITRPTAVRSGRGPAERGTGHSWRTRHELDFEKTKPCGEVRPGKEETR